MAIRIEKSFDVDRSPEEVWEFLVDPRRVVDCLPGAKIVRELDPSTYEGEIGLSLGPVGLTFHGTIRFDRRDRESYEVEMSGQGRDRQGGGSVRMSMVSKLTPLAGGGTHVAVSQTVSLAGRLASLGRGGLIESLADFLFGRFTKCMEERLAGG